MKKLSVFGIIGGAALLAAAPFSLQWSQETVTLSIDSADARIGRPLTALERCRRPATVLSPCGSQYAYAGAAGAVGYGVGAYYGGYGYPAYTAPSSPSYGTGYGYGSYYGGNSYPSSGYAGYGYPSSGYAGYSYPSSGYAGYSYPSYGYGSYLRPGLSRRPQGGDPSSPLALRLALTKSCPRGGAAAPRLLASWCAHRTFSRVSSTPAHMQERRGRRSRHVLMNRDRPHFR